MALGNRDQNIASANYDPDARATRVIGHDEPPSPTELLQGILDELKMIHLLLERHTGEEVSIEDLD